ncbi:MAG TPA: hypothetical protein VMU02_11760, partial [bacterium]|nr:hypothetical protein [bacterium]
MASWLAEVPTSDVPDSADLSSSEAIAADASANLHVAWLGNAGLEYREYLRNVGWAGAAERVDTLDEAWDAPCIAVDNAGDVHVIWWTYTGVSGEIYYREKHILTGWDATPTLLGNPKVDERSPSIAVDSQGVVHVVSCKTQPLIGPRIRYEFKDPVSGWVDGSIISQAEGGTAPVICVDSQDNLHVAWVGGNNDIYYRKCTHGIGWDATTTQLTTDGTNDEPCVAADGLGCVHVAWRHGGITGEIKYKKYVPGNGWDAAVTAISVVDSLYSCHPSIAADQSGA